jgi:hypothetical protein
MFNTLQAMFSTLRPLVCPVPASPVIEDRTIVHEFVAGDEGRPLELLERLAPTMERVDDMSRPPVQSSQREVIRT